MKKKILTGISVVTLCATGSLPTLENSTKAAFFQPHEQASRYETVRKPVNASDYIESMTTTKVGNNKIKVTIKTKFDVADNHEFGFFDALTGERSSYLGKDSVVFSKKIDNRTIELTTRELPNGDWRLSYLILNTLIENPVNDNMGRLALNQIDLRPYKVEVLIGNVNPATNANISLAPGQDFNIVADKKNVTEGDLVKFTLKVRDMMDPIFLQLGLINSTNSNATYSDLYGINKDPKINGNIGYDYLNTNGYVDTSYGFLDDNNNAVFFLKIARNNTLENTTYVLNKLAYTNRYAPYKHNSTFIRKDLAMFDNSTTLNFKTSEPSYTPILGNKKIGIISNLSEVSYEKNGIKNLIFFAKTSDEVNKKYILNKIYISKKGDSKEIAYASYSYNKDSYGNKLFPNVYPIYDEKTKTYSYSVNLNPGEYVISSVEVVEVNGGKHIKLPASELETSQANFKVISGRYELQNGELVIKRNEEWLDNVYRVGKNTKPIEVSKAIEPELILPEPPAPEHFPGLKNTTLHNKSGSIYFYDENENLVKNAWREETVTLTNGKTITLKPRWFGADGKMATNSWVDNNRYWVNEDGYKVINAWVDNGTVYVGNDGLRTTPPSNESNKPVELAKPDANTTVEPQPTNPVIKNGWIKEDKDWYFYKNNNQVKNAWQGNFWLNADGKMATNSWVDNNRYFVGANGAWVKDAVRKEGWKQENGAWYFYKNNNQVKNAWQGNFWLNADGKMATNSWVDNNRYFVGANGAWVKDAVRKEGWKQENGAWYFYKNNNQVKNAWQGNFWLDSDGKMATNSWVDNNRYFVGANGAWVKDAVHQSNKNGWIKDGNIWYFYKNGTLVRNTWVQGKYYVKANGAMAANEWIKVGNTHYYTKADGSYANNEFRGNYFLKANGAMAKNESFYYNGKEYTADANGYVNK